MKKTFSLLLTVLILGTSLPTLTGCARRTTQQKKTASYKRKARSGHTPCPCDSH